MSEGGVQRGAAHGRGHEEFWELWRANEVWLRQLCAGLYRGRPDDAEDVLRTAMARAWDQWTARDVPPSNPGGWLRVLTLNVSLTHTRIETRRARLLRAAVEGRQRRHESPEEVIHRRQVLAQAMETIDAMPPSIREPFVAYALHGHSFTEVAELYGLPMAAVRSRVRKARRILAAALEPGSPQEPPADSTPSDGLLPPRSPDDSDVVDPVITEIAWRLRDTHVVQVRLRTGGTLEYHAVFDQSVARRKQRIVTLERYVARHGRGWRRRYELAVLLIADSRVDEAEEHLRKVLELQPRHLPSVVRLGQLLVLQRRLEEAVAVYEAAQEQISARAVRLHLEGLKQRALAGGVFPQYAVAQREEHLQRAVDAFKAAIARDSRNLAHYHELGMTYDIWGKPAEALAAYDAALAVDPDDVFALARGHNPLLALWRYAEILPRLEKAVELDPNYTYALKLLVDRRAVMGLVRGAEGKRTLALGRRLLERNPTSADAMDAFARYYEHRGEAEKCVALWRAWLERNPDNAKGWTFYAGALWMVDDYAAAADAYVRSRELDPDWLDVYWRGTWVLIQVGRHDEAREWMAELERRSPNHWDSYATLGQSAMRLGDVEAALRYGRRSAELGADVAPALENYGALLVQAGRPAEALEPLRRSIELTGNREGGRCPTGLYWMGLALRALGREQEAMRSLREFVRRARAARAQHSHTDYHIGQGLEALGDLAGAERAYRRAARAGCEEARDLYRKLRARASEKQTTEKS